MAQTALPQTKDDHFLEDIAGHDRPVLVFFHQPADQDCAFTMLALQSLAGEDRTDVRITSLDTTANPVTATRFSLPDGPVIMLLRNNVILGYELGRQQPAQIEQWIKNTLSCPDANGIPVADFMQTIEKKQQRQKAEQDRAISLARRASIAGAAIRAAGGVVLATSFPAGGLNLAGYAIAGYSLARAFATYAAPQGQRPQAPQSRPGKILDAAANAVTWAGSFGLLGLAFNTMAGAAFYATTATAAVMLTHSSMGLGRLLPAGLLIGSLRRDADDMARRNPTKPLDEYSPPDEQAPPSQKPPPRP